jgi:hypothetical protein
MEDKTKHKELDNRNKKFMEKAMNDPDSLTDEEMDIFLKAMQEESDNNVMRHHNPRS